MAKSTGVVLAIGAITMVNRSVFHDEKIDWRVPIGTGIAAVIFAGLEQVWAEGSVLLAWTALAAVSLTRIDPDVPSPAESALDWWNSTGKKN